jgi:hypothetical protein
MYGWNGDSAGCGNQAIKQPVSVHLEVVSGGNGLDWSAATDENGHFAGDIPGQARALASYCGGSSIRVSLGPAAEIADDPLHPDASRHRKTAVMSAVLPSPDARSRPLLSSLRSDPTVYPFASKCCLDRAVSSTEAECTDVCLVAGGVASCANHQQACAMKAARSDEPSENANLCSSMFAECLVARGSSVGNLTRCKARCGELKSQEVCR